MTIEEIKNIGNIVFDNRDISPTQLGITSRKINYWLDHNLVPFVEKHQKVTDTDTISKEAATKTKWIRLNLSQAVWVCIIDTLSSFGVSADKIHTLGKSIWHEPRVDKYADKVFKEHIKENKHQLPDDVIQTLKQIVADEYWMKDFRTLINPFTDMLKSAILRESMPHTLLYVPQTNDFDFLYGDANLSLKLSSVYMQHPMLSIPLIPLLAKVLAVDFGNKKKELSYLSEIEKQIRDIIVFKKPKVVEIAFENENIKPIIVTEQHKTREQLAKYILENKIAKGAKLLIDIRAQGNYKLTLIKN
ncbi:hypothetical protein [Polaribacter tangerinus]|uniref:hypothetical protein n=1 Tax=Polaribacter tangerinus TaxID=1920034 RepID=UPI000B4BC8C9|nr:hypothetical protein [Polaribacter tangerinus]